MASSLNRETPIPPTDKNRPEKIAAARHNLDTDILFASGSEVVITHGQETYRLRLTRQNRLILTK